MAERRVDLATTNRGKAREIAAILAPWGIGVRVPHALPEVAETGATFAENARIKARHAARLLGRPALADDSGLVVPDLDGEPGVRSARYAGPEATDEENNARLIRRLEARGLASPPARFVCHAVLAAPDGRVLAEAEGRVEGEVRWPGRGTEGFGYDPLFHHPPTGLRFAEMRPAQKHAVSHRARALTALAPRLAALLPESEAGAQT